MKKKLFLLIFLILSAILFGGVQVHAAGEEGASSLDEYYQEQMETSGTNVFGMNFRGTRKTAWKIWV